MLQAYSEGAACRGSCNECLEWVLEVLVAHHVADTQSTGFKQALGGMLKASARGASSQALKAQCGGIVNAVLRLQAWPAMSDGGLVQEHYGNLEEVLEVVACRVLGGGGSVEQLLERYSDEVQNAWRNDVVQANVLSAAVQRLGVQAHSETEL